MTLALVRRPASSLGNCEVTHVLREDINLRLAVQQHDGYCQALRQLGADIEILSPLESYPDSVFIEDNAIILDELAVLTSMGTASRQGEADVVLPVLSQYRCLVEMRLPAKIEGGDVFRVGKTLYVGISSRTNHEGVEALRSIVEPFGYGVIVIPVKGCLHLKTACTPLDDETLLVNPAWLDLDALGKFRLLRIPSAELFGANVLRLPQGILANAEYPMTLDVIAAHGYSVAAVEMSEFSKAEAGVTCLSLILG